MTKQNHILIFFILQTIENNKQSLGNKAVSCPMSSFQTSPNNSQQIPDAIGPDQSMSISSDILRLESFCIHLQQNINDIAA